MSKGYTRTELARLLKVTAQTISDWENHRQEVPHMAIWSMAGLPKKQQNRRT